MIIGGISANVPSEMFANDECHLKCHKSSIYLKVGLVAH